MRACVRACVCVCVCVCGHVKTVKHVSSVWVRTSKCTVNALMYAKWLPFHHHFDVIAKMEAGGVYARLGNRC